MFPGCLAPADFRLVERRYLKGHHHRALPTRSPKSKKAELKQDQRPRYLNLVNVIHEGEETALVFSSSFVNLKEHSAPRGPSRKLNRISGSITRREAQKLEIARKDPSQLRAIIFIPFTVNGSGFCVHRKIVSPFPSMLYLDTADKIAPRSSSRTFAKRES